MIWKKKSSVILKIVAIPIFITFDKSGKQQKFYNLEPIKRANWLILFYFFDKKRNKKSVFYEDKYKLEANTIYLESFYPSSGGKTNRYSKVISKGVIKNDTIFIEFFGTPHKYVKKTYSQIFE